LGVSGQGQSVTYFKGVIPKPRVFTSGARDLARKYLKLADYFLSFFYSCHGRYSMIVDLKSQHASFQSTIKIQQATIALLEPIS
jgi:hypothetical protein